MSFFVQGAMRMHARQEEEARRLKEERLKMIAEESGGRLRYGTPQADGSVKLKRQMKYMVEEELDQVLKSGDLAEEVMDVFNRWTRKRLQDMGPLMNDREKDEFFEMLRLHEDEVHDQMTKVMRTHAWHQALVVNGVTYMPKNEEEMVEIQDYKAEVKFKGESQAKGKKRKPQAQDHLTPQERKARAMKIVKQAHEHARLKEEVCEDDVDEEGHVKMPQQPAGPPPGWRVGTTGSSSSSSTNASGSYSGAIGAPREFKKE